MKKTKPSLTTHRARSGLAMTGVKRPRAAARPVTADEFAGLMDALAVDLTATQNIAVAVSGGGDSMALLMLLARWLPPSIKLHVLTVDHGLRPESKPEAKQVAAWVQHMPGVIHQTLPWRGPKPTTKIAETARAKRYDLLSAYCRRHRIRPLFLAHHLDDQAETFLLRLSAGSGVDGLSAMRGVERLSIDVSSPRMRGPILPQETDVGSMSPRLRGDNILLLRPLLSIPHDRLLATLRAAGQDWIEDPTNVNQEYARPRLRAVRDVLAREGLTAERLAITAERCARTRDVVAWAVDHAWGQVTENRMADRLLPLKGGGEGGGDISDIKIPCATYKSWPDDIQIRILMRAITTVGGRAPRLQQVETLWADLAEHVPTVSRPVRRTLGGAVITASVKGVTVRGQDN